jgi:hypothetical protein
VYDSCRPVRTRHAPCLAPSYCGGHTRGTMVNPSEPGAGSGKTPVHRLSSIQNTANLTFSCTARTLEHVHLGNLRSTLPPCVVAAAIRHKRLAKFRFVSYLVFPPPVPRASSDMDEGVVHPPFRSLSSNLDRYFMLSRRIDQVRASMWYGRWQSRQQGSLEIAQ